MVEPLKFIFVIAIGLGPIYLLPSGLPQIGDWFLLAWVVMSISLMPRFSFRVLRMAPVQLAGILVFHMMLVSIGWAVYLHDVTVVLHAPFYLFNFFVSWNLVIWALREGDAWRVLMRNVLALAAFVLLITFLLNFDPSGFRQTAAFNNPNQLGYYSLLLVCMAFVVFGRQNWRSLRFIFIIGVGTIFILFSSSLAAWGALVVAVFGGAMMFGARQFVRLALVGLLLLCVVGAGLHFSPLGGQLERQILARVAVFERKVDLVGDERGYSRITEFPAYTVLGAGEGALYRFGPRHSNELHSSLGTLLFSYGIPGLALFLGMIWYVLRRKVVGVMVVTLAPFVYSFSHQGLRTTLFWIFLMLVWVYGDERAAFGAKKGSMRTRSRTPFSYLT